MHALQMRSRFYALYPTPQTLPTRRCTNHSSRLACCPPGRASLGANSGTSSWCSALLGGVPGRSWGLERFGGGYRAVRCCDYDLRLSQPCSVMTQTRKVRVQDKARVPDSPLPHQQPSTDSNLVPGSFEMRQHVFTVLIVQAANEPLSKSLNEGSRWRH